MIRNLKKMEETTKCQDLFMLGTNSQDNWSRNSVFSAN